MHTPEEVRHASRNAESVCPFLYWRDGKKGHAESALRDACRTSSVHTPPKSYLNHLGKGSTSLKTHYFFTPKVLINRHMVVVATGGLMYTKNWLYIISQESHRKSVRVGRPACMGLTQVEA